MERAKYFAHGVSRYGVEKVICDLLECPSLLFVTLVGRSTYQVTNPSVKTPSSLWQLLPHRLKSTIAAASPIASSSGHTRYVGCDGGWLPDHGADRAASRRTGLVTRLVSKEWNSWSCPLARPGLAAALAIVHWQLVMHQADGMPDRCASRNPLCVTNRLVECGFRMSGNAKKLAATSAGPGSQHQSAANHL
ncbi:hypothetical protein G7046_g273 [Stylonectria norvegica]|nr:hypothetical protein G7046_g273 [Stylonectria norvegica]